jgi:hypothetical protein
MNTDVLLICVVGSIVVGIIAAKVRGRSGWGWFFLSVLFSPLLMGILLLFLPKLGRHCPFCAEVISEQAQVCKHCGRDLDPTPPALMQ